MAGKRRLCKSRDKKICGVCGGIAQYFGIDPTFVRIIWAVLAFAWGTSIWVYFILAFILDDADEREQIEDETYTGYGSDENYIDAKERPVSYKDVKINKEDYVDVDYRPVEEISDQPIGFDPSKYEENNR